MLGLPALPEVHPPWVGPPIPAVNGHDWGEISCKVGLHDWAISPGRPKVPPRGGPLYYCRRCDGMAYWGIPWWINGR